MHAVAVLALALAPAAPALKDRPKDNDRSPVGEWAVESVTLPGAPRPTSTGLRYTFTADGRWLIHRNGQEVVGVHTNAVFLALDLGGGPGGHLSGRGVIRRPRRGPCDC
jgi:hypothetical protein